MRMAIRQALIDSIPSIGGRVYEPHAASSSTEKPYIVLRQGSEAEESPWAGFRRLIEVWPYVTRSSFQAVDALAQEIIQALDQKLLSSQNGEAFTCHYLGTTGQDFVDPDWDALTRGLRFSVLALQPLAVQETFGNDPWIEALSRWLESSLPGWTIYRNRWPLGYKRPSVLVRLTRVEAAPGTHAVYRVAKHIQAHVLGATPNEEVSGALQILQKLQEAVKIPLDAAARRYLAVEDPNLDYRLDALSSGQLTFTLSRMTLRPQEEVPLIGHVYSYGSWR